MAERRYFFKTEPYEHQFKALKRLIKNGYGGALLMEPRTGKTKVCIDWASYLHTAGKVNRVLVMCPFSVLDVWVNEIKTHCPVKYRITVWDKQGRKTIPLPPYGDDVLDFVLINYDAFSAPAAIKGKDEYGATLRYKKKGGKYEVVKAFRLWKPDAIILDESHRIKSTGSKKTMSIINMQWMRKADGLVTPLAPYRVIATGTPITKQKRVHDIYAQWKFLNPKSKLVKGHTAASFKAEYSLFIDKGGFPSWVKNRNEAKLHKLVHKDSFSAIRSECFDLPPAFPDQIIRVPLEESAKAYDEMAATMVAKVEEGEYTEATIPLTQILRFGQITSGLARTVPTEAHPDGRLIRIGREKLRYLEELLTDYFDQGEKVVVCARFRGDYVGIQEVAAKLKVEPQLLIGGMSRQERTEAIERFRVKDGPALFIMNPQAGSLGIDLRTASTMIWFSLTQSYVDYSQSLDRIALSDVACRFIYLLAEGTYDELQYAALQEDGNVAKAIIRDPKILLREYAAQKSGE